MINLTQPDGSRRFLNMSGGMLALVIVLVILAPCLCLGGLALIGAIGG